ncbi:hypothetical protein L873DRAFT_53118 [Choiromyces venosus 120613-1]|uniref:Uncharacterized protein n=1 Tax=Choiromyces venosus 120613-1 TaxID=1336337 RepID=A0A3N4J5E1_9PEZI|nr:hypothetical protein L873DRAFT_53118 [Choiromyces venosus 120613-1]
MLTIVQTNSLDPKCTGGTAWPTFTKPPCPTTTTKEPASPTQTCTQRICADYVNECGQWYGGCFLDPVCTGGTKWPSFTKPTCPPTTTAALKPRTTTSCDSTICADFVNECGLKYGGCFLDPKCTGGTAWPTFSKPPCPTTSRTTSTRKPVKTCSQSICADYVNECGRKYGGRFLGPKCTSGTAWPKFPKPPCPTTITTTECSTICAEYINECGQQFGQCL